MKKGSEIEIINNPSNIQLEYDAISPLTGNRCVIVEADENTNIESYICMESGYTTLDNLKIGSDTSKEYEKSLTQLMIDARYEDNLSGLVWYPSFMQMPGSMLYCIGDTPDELKWQVARTVPIIGEERKQYPIPGRVDEYYTSKLDVENAKTYGKYDFKDALDDLYSIIKEEDNED